jgi:hypothetical protein
MTIPSLNVTINFSTGPVFANPFVLGVGVLGTNVLADSAGVIVDVSNQVDQITTTRGRNVTADQFQTGTLTLRIVDQNGSFNPMNTAGPYYGLLTPMRKVIMNATYSGVVYPIFAGYITSYTTVTPKFVGDVAYTTITAVDGFRLFNLAQIATVAGAAAGDLASTRLNQILDTIQWPTSMREIDTGIQTVQADPGTARTSLQAMQTVELSEYGALYMNAVGNVEFHNRNKVSGSAGGTPTVFSDTGSGLKYYNALWLLNDALVYNSASITRTGGAAQVATSVASIAKYFLHSYNQTNLLMQTDADALNYANAYVTSRAETTIRCDALTLDLYTADYDLGIKAALGLDYFDPVTITTTQPGSSAITKTEQVFGVAHQITPNSWKTTFTTLEPLIDSFILNSTSFGILDTSVLSY